jgi:D-aminopeptidase
MEILSVPNARVNFFEVGVAVYDKKAKAETLQLATAAEIAQWRPIVRGVTGTPLRFAARVLSEIDKLLPK